MLTTMVNERKGMLAGPRALNKLAPFFYVPRWQNQIELGVGQLNALLLMIPMGISNWSHLSIPVRQKLEERINSLCCGEGLSAVGVSRKLGDEIFARGEELCACPSAGAVGGRPVPLIPAGDHRPPLQMDDNGPPLVCRNGDYFIAAMTGMNVKKILGEDDIHRIVVAGDEPEAWFLAYYLSDRFKWPVILQSREPQVHEKAAARLLYQEGIALPLGVFNPEKWNKNDIVILCEEYYVYWGSLYGEGHKLNIGNNSKGHAPLLEQAMLSKGIDPALHNLAPFIETCLLSDENGSKRQLIDRIDEKGGGIWQYFLDKEIGAHYNTLKGF